jgi:mannosyltransferase
MPKRVALRRAVGAPLTLGALGTIVALVGSWNVSLWTDEAATIAAARRTPSELLSLVQHIDAVHALYYFAIHAWASIFGYSPVALRLPSALCVGISVVGVYVLTRSLGSASGGGRDRPDAAVLAAVIAVVLPRITWMGIEARSFGPSAAVAVWTTVILLHALRPSARRRLWLAYGALVAVGVALNIYVALIVVAHALTVAALPALGYRRRLAWLAAATAGALASSPVVLLAASQKGQLGDNAVSLSTMLRRAIVNQWFLGETPTRVGSSNDGSALWAVSATLLAAVCWLLMVIAVVVSVRRDRRARSAPGRIPATVVLVPWLLVPTITVVLYSLVVSPLYNARYFTFCAPAVAVLTALGVAALRARRVEIGVVALIVLLASPIYLSQRSSTGKSGTDWSQVASYVETHARPGDGVYFSPTTPTASASIGRTTRTVAIAYPAAFGQLRDVTFDVSGADGDTLGTTSVQLSSAAATSRLAGLDTLWVVRRRDYPRGAERADTSDLEAAGFSTVRTWTGPVDEVVEFRRR